MISPPANDGSARITHLTLYNRFSDGCVPKPCVSDGRSDQSPGCLARRPVEPIRLPQPCPGSAGTIKSGPQTNQGYIWWNINFDTGCDGWSVQTYLTTALAMTSDNAVQTAAA